MALLANPTKLPVLERYEVLNKIGDGSMASVYRARSRATGELVALKLPVPAVAENPVLLQRFQEEFRVGNLLNHPGLIRALELGREGPTYYLVMELVDGRDLWQRLQEGGPLSEPEAVRILVQVAEGLHEAHRHGIIHRDVKPDNVLLGADGKAKIGDLGLIKDLEGELGLTQTRRGLGTPNFMAPEQFGDARHAGVACDIYSLGATLYTAVTGALPFHGRSLAATLKKKQNNDLKPPRQIVPALSERLEWVILRSVQANPAQRYASCPEFIQALTGEAAACEPRPVLRAGRGGSGATERRRSLRYPCTLVTVCGVSTSIHPEEVEAQDEWQGTVQNLSVQGVGLLLSRRLEPGTVVSLRLESPDRSFRRCLELSVRRVKATRDGRWATGGTFRVPLDRDELQQLL